ncbi:MAG TPA: TraB/GumN family protein [Puia sp.]
MRSTPLRKYFVALVLFLSLASSLAAQKRTEKKYPALLWEITGNGLTKPSYLFGTMHVSSKLVFHLSDSFYLDIRNADVVALELDPQLWQDQLFRFQNMQTNLRFYTQGSPGDYINERSFQLEKYDDKLKSALSDEPTVINGLLYRSFQTKADFEEDTYLDLYIYQTGKKLGKQATGVENYFQTEQLVMEAAQDMMKDKKKKASDTDGESAFDIEKKTQDAYRKGDLDMLDSLEKLLQPSDAYMEKFLYRRNEIQAASIDSIVRHHSLFVGVGAAHLPGKRGVIELLRKKGYTLRPVTMPDRDAIRRDDIDKIKVPVTFSTFTADDGGFTVQLPGKLYRRSDSRTADSWQYADMGNGAYYMIGRVKTYGCFLGQKDETTLKKIDSLLYENIPGKILKKTVITRSGYKGFDITGKTRRGDIQRYNILVTPYEVLVFKMSGTNNYVEGKEADLFFNSIEIKKNGPAGWTDFTPPQGGFRIRLPRTPSQHKNTSNVDGISRWEYEAGDSATSDAFLVWKKTVQNYRFLEEDTADLALMEESFHLSDWIEKPLSRRTGLYKGVPCLDAAYLAKDGSIIKAKFLIKGPQYYLLAARSHNKDKAFPAFFNSFDFTPYRYGSFRNYVDTFINIRVTTPMVPDIDVGMRGILERASSEEFLNSIPDYNSYWPRAKTALFQDDSTGEAVFVSMETFPKYYYPKDSATFWLEECNEKRLKQDFIIHSKEPLRFSDSVIGFKYVLADTNSSRLLHTWIFEKDNRFFRMISLDDSLQGGSEFTTRFYASLHPLDKRLGPSVFTNKLDLFFGDFYSKDSLANKRAKDAIPNVYFGAAGVPALLRAINGLSYNEKDYFNTKTRLINELGYISDSTAIGKVVGGLKNIYEKAGDTSTFQNAVLKALAHQKTRPGYDLLKTLLVQDPPIFENNSDYNYLFQDLEDSLPLARTLFPDLLQLSTVDDYKDNILSLLSTLVDSGYLNGADYESHFPQLYFDAKIQWKKQEGRDERQLQKKEEDNGDEAAGNEGEGAGNQDSQLDDYAILLMPFYDKNPTVPHFFNKLLQSKDASLRLSTSALLLRNNKPVADSIIRALAVSDLYRSRLLKSLEAIHRGDRFPRSFRNQVDIARSLLVGNRSDNEGVDIQFVDKKPVQFKDMKGTIYFFKYKLNKDDDWQIGLSGLQPVNPKEVNTDNEFVRLTGKKIRPDTPVKDQFEQQLKKLLFSKRKSAASFYLDNDYYGGKNEED